MTNNIDRTEVGKEKKWLFFFCLKKRRWYKNKDKDKESDFLKYFDAFNQSDFWLDNWIYFAKFISNDFHIRIIIKIMAKLLRILLHSFFFHSRSMHCITVHGTEPTEKFFKSIETFIHTFFVMVKFFTRSNKKKNTKFEILIHVKIESAWWVIKKNVKWCDFKTVTQLFCQMEFCNGTRKRNETPRP